MRLSTSCEEQAAQDWPGQESRRLLHWRIEDGEDVMTVDVHRDRGYRLSALRQGTHYVSGDGSRIVSVPPPEADWFWQRYLVGQVLPLAAVLNGYEVLHASAVALEGRAVAFSAPSGVGKTSLGLNLVLRGARFLSDDVACLSVEDGQPILHPGPGLTNLRRQEAGRLGGRRALLGEVIGSDAATLRIRVPRDASPAPLAALYFLERASGGPRPRVEELEQVDFATLAVCGFTPFVSTPERLHRQLITCAAIAERVRVFRLSIPPTVDAEILSAFVERHVRHDVG